MTPHIRIINILREGSFLEGRTKQQREQHGMFLMRNTFSKLMMSYQNTCSENMKASNPLVEILRQ